MRAWLLGIECMAPRVRAGVNLGCVEGLDPLALEISIIDGKALPVIEEAG